MIRASGNFFRTFGVQPWIGRLFSDADDKVGAPLVAVMSYRVWQQKYGADPSVVGSGFQIDVFAFYIRRLPDTATAVRQESNQLGCIICTPGA